MNVWAKMTWTLGWVRNECLGKHEVCAWVNTKVLLG